MRAEKKTDKQTDKERDIDALITIYLTPDQVRRDYKLILNFEMYSVVQENLTHYQDQAATGRNVSVANSKAAVALDAANSWHAAAGTEDLSSRHKPESASKSN